jgi:hypothetical protein
VGPAHGHERRRAGDDRDPRPRREQPERREQRARPRLGAAPEARAGEHDRGDGRVGRGHGTRRSERDSHTRARRVGKRAHDPLERAEDQVIERAQRAGGEAWQLGQRRLDHPDPHDRGNDRQRNDVRHEPRQRQRPEVVRDERRGGERGRNRDGDAVCQQPRQGGQRPRYPPRQQQDARNGRERELPAGVAHHARVDRQRDRRGQFQRVPPGGRPRRAHRHEPGGAHDSGSLK